MIEELLDEAMDLIKGMMETENNVSVTAFEPDSVDDDDEKDENESDDEEDSTSAELPDGEPDDVEING